MENKNGFIAFALLGLDAGAAAYYLLGTDDGKRQLERANESVKDVRNSSKEPSKKDAKRAAKNANSTSAELANLKTKAKDAGVRAVDAAADKAHKVAGKASQAVHLAEYKAVEVVNRAKSEPDKA